MGDDLTFDNLDLYIGPGHEGLYPVSVQSSPAGETAAPVEVPIETDHPALQACLKGLDQGNASPADLQALGRQLAGYLFPAGPLRDLYQRNRGAVEAAGRRLRLRLRVVPPELAALPWEYAYDDDVDDFFALNPLTTLVRYANHPHRPAEIAAHIPVPVLLIMCSPPGFPALDVLAETENLLDALRDLLEAGRARAGLLYTGGPGQRAEVERLVAERTGVRLLAEEASLRGLSRSLREGYRLVHYTGHGAYDETLGGLLLLAGERDQVAATDAQVLARTLRGSQASVVVLNTCRSAAGGSGQSFMGLAPHLVASGIPAVVAMQYAISDGSARVFSATLYQALAAGLPLDSAVTEGRKAIVVQPDDGGLEWGIPALFMRAPDGVIWRTQADLPSEAAGQNQNAPTLPSVQIGGHTYIGGDVVGGNKVQITGDTYHLLAGQPGGRNLVPALEAIKQELGRLADSQALDEETTALAGAQIKAALINARKPASDVARICRRLQEARVLIEHATGKTEIVAGLSALLARTTAALCPGSGGEQSMEE